MSLDDLNREQKRQLKRMGALDEQGAAPRHHRHTVEVEVRPQERIGPTHANVVGAVDADTALIEGDEMIEDTVSSDDERRGGGDRFGDLLAGRGQHVGQGGPDEAAWILGGGLAVHTVVGLVACAALAPGKAGTSSAHGSPLGADTIDASVIARTDGMEVRDTSALGAGASLSDTSPSTRPTAWAMTSRVSTSSSLRS